MSAEKAKMIRHAVDLLNEQIVDAASCHDLQVTITVEDGDPCFKGRLGEMPVPRLRVLIRAWMS